MIGYFMKISAPDFFALWLEAVIMAIDLKHRLPHKHFLSLTTYFEYFH
jgi:hypothetical protein